MISHPSLTSSDKNSSPKKSPSGSSKALSPKLGLAILEGELRPRSLLGDSMKKPPLEGELKMDETPLLGVSLISGVEVIDLLSLGV